MFQSQYSIDSETVLHPRGYKSRSLSLLIVMSWKLLRVYILFAVHATDISVNVIYVCNILKVLWTKVCCLALSALISASVNSVQNCVSRAAQNMFVKPQCFPERAASRTEYRFMDHIITRLPFRCSYNSNVEGFPHLMAPLHRCWCAALRRLVLANKGTLRGQCLVSVKYR